MRWKDRRQSENVEDRRGTSTGTLTGGGLLLLIGVILVVKCMGGDPQPLMDSLGTQAQPGSYTPQTPEEEERAQFVGVVLADTEDVWNEVFRKMGKRYVEPGLMLYTQGTRSGCGFASSAVGPFYCPADSNVYIDLSFFQDLADRFGAPGDFAQAYVLAHEVGHHVQRLLGFSEQVDRARGRVSKAQQNELSVRLELQADFLAGVFAHYIGKKGYLETGDIEEAIRAANAIGDDRLQMEARGRVMPDSFTHGTSKQRMSWFALGFKTGDLALMDTFDDAHFAKVNRRR